MELSQQIYKSLEKILKELKLSNIKFAVEHPANEGWGDYSTNVGIITRKAKEICAKLKAEDSMKKIASKISVAGAGFINISIKSDVLINQINQVLIDNEKKPYQGKKYLVEHTSPNPNKAMHLGHLTNNVIGMALANIFEALGCQVVRDCVDNNRGIAIAKLMWGYLKFGHKQEKQITDLNYWYDHQDEWQTPADAKMRPDRFVDELYVKASEDCKTAEAEKAVRQMVIDWEAGDKKNRALWAKVLKYSYQGQELTLKRLGNKWDRVWHEHEHYQQGKDLVEAGLKKGVFRKGKEGAIVTDLTKYNIPDTVVIKADGTALYITQDLALTKLKKETFKPDKLFWVIGPEQSLALKQMFAVCEQLGIVKIKECQHVSYGWMSLKGKGRMSSRTGRVVYIDDLLDQAVKKTKEIMRRSGESEVEKAKVDEVAEKIGVGAVKYSILKVGRTKDMAFDFDESISLEGNSGPYLQYTYARAKSVLSKGPTLSPDIRRDAPKALKVGPYSKEEDLLLRTLYRYEEVVSQAAAELAPNLIANFLYDLAQKYNGFYNRHQILKAEKEVKEFRLWLTQVTAEVIKKGLMLLGIATPERM